MLPTLIHLRPALNVSKLFRLQPQISMNRLALQPSLISPLSRLRIPTAQFTTFSPKPISSSALKTPKFKQNSQIYKPYTTIAPTSNKGRNLVIGLAMLGALTLIPDLLSSILIISGLGFVALTYFFTFSFVFVVGLFIATILALIAVVFSIPAIDLYFDCSKMIEANQLVHGWRIVPMEHRGLITRQGHRDSISHFEFKIDSDEDFKQNSFFKMYIDLGKVVGNSTPLTGKVSLQRECFGLWIYSIPFDLDYINEADHHSASFKESLLS
ncbi:hypothetical protein HDV06_005593 [Boothiomyces sp. JEL0866]|nr:hypothetical protein HDV06_005593 [Boothiomyces sp. JEL0866]